MCLSVPEGWGKSVWGPNVQEFRLRFDPAGTKGEGTRRLKNLYFLYLIELRALSKVAPYFDRAVINLYTGNHQEDASTKELLLHIFNETRWVSHSLHTTHYTLYTHYTHHTHYTHRGAAAAHLQRDQVHYTLTTHYTHSLYTHYTHHTHQGAAAAHLQRDQAHYTHHTH